MGSDAAQAPSGGVSVLAEVIIDIPTKALERPFTYVVPEGMEAEVGCAVRVPFGRQQVVGFVTRVTEPGLEEPVDTRVKPIEEVLSEPLFSSFAVETAGFLAKRYIAPLPACIRLFFPAGAAPKIKRTAQGGWEVIKPKVGSVEEVWLTRGPEADGFTPRKGAHRQEVVLDAIRRADMRASELRYLYGDVSQAVKALERAGAVKREHRRRFRDGVSVPDALNGCGRPEELTDSQKRALDEVSHAMDDDDVTAVLVDGVTGSGKTEVYLQAIERAIRRGQGAIVLVPEISLTPQTVARFRGRFGDMVAVMHSKMSVGERYDQWDMLRHGAARIVVGARSALFMPVQNLGLIVVDEEHESTYKQESAPRYVTRDVACWMARRRSATVVLGSATPSIEALVSAKQDPYWRYVHLPERANGRPMPEVEVVDMAAEFRRGGKSIFSAKLRSALINELDAGHKVVLMLNQRGFAKFLLCRDCGFVPECRWCSTTLTYHEAGNKLVCHHCGYTVASPAVCPSCSSPYLFRYGVGTQRVEAELRDILRAQDELIAEPGARTEGRMRPEIIRMDADTTAAKGAHVKLLERFANADAAVLLGTQMIAKGLDFDDVTLVGVINADTMLHLPDFRASERTFDLIQQVAGRAGRAELSGRVIVQTYEADAEAIRAASAYDRRAFLRSELAKREVLGFPPFMRMVNVLVWGHDGRAVAAAAKDYQRALEESIARAHLEGFEVLAASPCAFERVRGLIRWHIIVKCPSDSDPSALLGAVHRARPKADGVSTAVDVDPVDLL